MGNIKFQNALKRIPQKTPPVWMMRQAGRYHKHYQGLRKEHDFITLCKEPELAAEVAMGPIQDFDFDIAILFSDLLFPLEALGLGLHYDPSPRLERHLTHDVIPTLRSREEALAGLQFQKQAMMATRARLPKDKSLIGFVGGPWTLFTYAVEGAHKGHLVKAKTQASLYRQFAEILVPLMQDNIRLQIEGGAEVVMIMDTAAGETAAPFFRHVLERDILKMTDVAPGKIGYYSKGTVADHLERLWTNTNFAGFGYDHRWELSRMFDRVPHGFVQGNFDQALLFAHESDFPKILNDYLEEMIRLTPDQRAGWVAGLGHGVLPETPEKHVRMFVERVREVFA
jgi:uroporphyrinogen decarboxylase